MTYPDGARMLNKLNQALAAIRHGLAGSSSTPTHEDGQPGSDESSGEASTHPQSQEERESVLHPRKSSRSVEPAASSERYDVIQLT